MSTTIDHRKGRPARGSADSKNMSTSMAEESKKPKNSKKELKPRLLPPDLTAEEVAQQLERILAADIFVRADRQSRFLRYVVNQALDGNGDDLKEYSIAIEVFDRPKSFDARIDPIVRVEAGRLRSRIREYYDTDGKDDLVWIGLSKRGYRPVFEKRLQSGAAAGEAEEPATGGPEAALESSGSSEEKSDSGYRSIAVLPFADLSPQQTQEYFCDGLTQQIINALAKFRELRVVGSTSAFQFKDRTEDIRQIGKELRVGTVVEGSVQKAAKQVRVNVQLLSAVDGFDLWGETYDLPLEDIFAIEDKVTRSVVEGLKTTLLADAAPSKTETKPAGKSKPSKNKSANLEAYNEYLKGLYHWNKRTEGELRKSIEYFQTCIRKDPQYGSAYAGLAACYAVLGISSVIPPQEIMPKAVEAASTALELDPESAKAYACLGLVKSLYEWDWAGAKQAFDRALELNPRLSSAHHWYAIGYLMSLGRLEEAIERIEHAHELNPASVMINTHVGLVHYMKRQYDRAIWQLKLAIEMEPEFYRAHWDLGRAYEQDCKLDEALQAFQKAKELASTFRLGAMGHCYAAFGDKAEARKILNILTASNRKSYTSPYDIAEIYLGLGDHDEMFAWLNKAYKDRSPWLSWIGVDPIFDGVRSDQRFQKLLKKLGLESDQTPAAEPAVAST